MLYISLFIIIVISLMGPLCSQVILDNVFTCSFADWQGDLSRAFSVGELGENVYFTGL